MQLPSARTLLSLSSGNTRDEEEDRASNPSSQQMNANGGGDPFTAANINVYQYNEQQSRKYPPPQCAATLPAHPESSDPLFWAYHQIPPASTSGVRPHQTSAHILSNIEPLRHSGGPYPIPLRAVHDDYRSHAYDPYRQRKFSEVEVPFRALLSGYIGWLTPSSVCALTLLYHPFRHSNVIRL